MIKVNKVLPTLSNEQRGMIQIDIAIVGAGTHFLFFEIKKTDAGWTAVDGRKRDIGVCADDVHTLGEMIKDRLEGDK